MDVWAGAVYGRQRLLRLVFKFLAVIKLEIRGQRGGQRVLSFAILGEDKHTRAGRRTVPADLFELPLEQLKTRRVADGHFRKRRFDSSQEWQFWALGVSSRDCLIALLYCLTARFWA